MVATVRRKSCAILVGVLLGGSCVVAAAEEPQSTFDPDPVEPGEVYQPRMQQAAQAAEGSDAASILRHVRGAPGTAYGSSIPEIDRRLNSITR